MKLLACAILEKNVSYKTCKKWYQRFKAGNFNLEEDDRSGALRKFDDDELEELLNENPTRMQEELVEKSAVMK